MVVTNTWKDLSETDEKSDEDDEDDIPLNQLAGQLNGGKKKGLLEKAVNHTYHWRQRDIPKFTKNYKEIFSPPPDEPHTPLQYFSTFFRRYS